MLALKIVISSLLVVLVGCLIVHPIPIFSPTILEAGDTYGNGSISGQFHVFNLGLRSLKIDSYKGSCTCSRVDGPPSLPAFSWSTLSVNIKSRGISGGYHVELAVEFDEEPPKILTVYGNRIITCRPDPQSICLSVLDETSPTRMQTELAFVFSEPVAADSLSFISSSTRLKIVPISTLTGYVRNVRLRLDYDYTGQQGSFTDWVKIKYFMQKPGDYTVQVRGKLPGGLQVDPEEVDLSDLSYSNKSRILLAVAGLQTGEKLDNIRFSGIKTNKSIAWSIDNEGNIDLAFAKPEQIEALAPFSMLARTNKGQTASVYFSR